MTKISISAKSVLLIGALSVCACMNNIEATTTPVKDRSVFETAKRLVADRMRDPEATRFKPQYSAYKTQQGDHIVCGTLNGKNAMGGYNGYKPFYVRIRNGSIEALQIPPERDDYAVVLNSVRKACADAAAGKVMLGS